MSTGSALSWDEAYAIARDVAQELRPHALRVKAVGSLRRRRPTVGDIEFLVEPAVEVADLFGTLTPVVAPIRAVLEQLGRWVKGADRMMQVSDLLGRPGLTCEVYLVHPPAQWGSQLAIRTGPSDLGKLAVTLMHHHGLREQRGHVIEVRTGNVLPTPTEEDFFRLAGLPCWPPAKRDELIQRIQRGEDLRIREVVRES